MKNATTTETTYESGGVRAVVTASSGGGWSVGVQDTDCGEWLPTRMIFPLRDDAEKFAAGCV